MQQLLFWGLGLWVLAQINKKKGGAQAAAQVAPGSAPDFETGRVKVLDWPLQTPTTIQEIEYPLFYVGPGGRTIGPATACSLPNKLQLKQDMISAIQRLQILASMWQQMNPQDRESGQGDRIRDEVEEMTNKLNSSYQKLKNGCLARPAQTFSPDTTTQVQRVAP